jgi:alanine transaminase
LIRQHAAEFIAQRDGGIPADPENVCLSGGASESIRVCERALFCPWKQLLLQALLKLFVKPAGKGKPAGVMIPIPQYPLYSASTEEMGLSQVRPMDRCEYRATSDWLLLG